MKADSAPRPRGGEGPQKAIKCLSRTGSAGMHTALAGGRRARARCGNEALASRGPGLPLSSLCGLQQQGGGGLGVPKIKMKNKKKSSPESPVLAFGSVMGCIGEQLLFRIHGPQPNTGAELRLQKDSNVSPFVL